MRLFRNAILVDQSNLASSELIINSNQFGQRKAKHTNNSYISKKSYKEQILNEEPNEKSLFYYQRSPNFCEADSSFDIPGNKTYTRTYRWYIGVVDDEKSNWKNDDDDDGDDEEGEGLDDDENAVHRM